MLPLCLRSAFAPEVEAKCIQIGMKPPSTLPIHLSDETKKPTRWWAWGDSAAIRTQDLLLRRQLLYPAELRNRFLNVLIRKLDNKLTHSHVYFLLPSSGHPDSNWGSPAPKAGAITGLRYIPDATRACREKERRHTDVSFLWRRRGDSNPRYPNRVRQFSKLLVSATHPPLRSCTISTQKPAFSFREIGCKSTNFF